MEKTHLPVKPVGCHLGSAGARSGEPWWKATKAHHCCARQEVGGTGFWGTPRSGNLCAYPSFFHLRLIFSASRFCFCLKSFKDPSWRQDGGSSQGVPRALRLQPVSFLCVFPGAFTDRGSFKVRMSSIGVPCTQLFS